jgi:hypothetical protein
LQDGSDEGLGGGRQPGERQHFPSLHAPCEVLHSGSLQECRKP